MGRRQVCVTIDEKLVEEMERIREESSMSVSRQIELRLMGYELVKIHEPTIEELEEHIEVLRSTILRLKEEK